MVRKNKQTKKTDIEVRIEGIKKFLAIKKEVVYIERGFPCSTVGKESACNAGDLGLIPGSGKAPGEANGNSLQYSCLENPKDGGAGGLPSMGLHRVRHD